MAAILYRSQCVKLPSNVSRNFVNEIIPILHWVFVLTSRYHHQRYWWLSSWYPSIKSLNNLGKRMRAVHILQSLSDYLGRNVDLVYKKVAFRLKSAEVTILSKLCTTSLTWLMLWLHTVFFYPTVLYTDLGCQCDAIDVITIARLTLIDCLAAVVLWMWLMSKMIFPVIVILIWVELMLSIPKGISQA